MLRLVNQEFVDSQIQFYMNGHCHGELVFSNDLKWCMHGKKVVKSIQERLIDIKQHILGMVLSNKPVHDQKYIKRRHDKRKADELKKEEQ